MNTEDRDEAGREVVFIVGFFLTALWFSQYEGVERILDRATEDKRVIGIVLVWIVQIVFGLLLSTVGGELCVLLRQGFGIATSKYVHFKPRHFAWYVKNRNSGIGLAFRLAAGIVLVALLLLLQNL